MKVSEAQEYRLAEVEVNRTCPPDRTYEALLRKGLILSELSPLIGLVVILTDSGHAALQEARG